MKPITLDLLGSTGSIGEQAIDVARRRGVRIRALCAGTDHRRVAEQAREFHPAYCAMADEKAARQLKASLADTDIKVLSGADGICEMIARSDARVSLNAIVGEAGLLPTLSVIDAGKRLALANKESLVVAGDIVMAKAKEKEIEITPVDSEHCAIHQCLRAGEHKQIKRLLVTASGGPFFGYDREALSRVTAADALAHPTWAMGAKITIDSATLMNKGFELIEASHLFDVPMERIDAVVHRESIIHSMVEYIDNSIMAQMSVPDMRYCIQYGITGGARCEAVVPALELTAVGGLSFYPPDTKCFPLLVCAVECKKQGGGMPAVLNAANEVAVAAFLEGKISFLGISETVENTVSSLSRHKAADTLATILAADREARVFAEEYVAHHGIRE